MNDSTRHLAGLSGTLAAWLTLENGAILAALAASLATAAFMSLSALEKWEARRARLNSTATKNQPATK